MKISTLIALGITLIALDAAQADFAAEPVKAASVATAQSANPTYFPSGEQVTVAATELPRVTVRQQAEAVSHNPSTTWMEFGAGSHDESLSAQTRAEVKNEARSVEHPATRSYFSY